MNSNLRNKKDSIFIITGEQSGDSNASIIINELCKLNPDISLAGIGGNELEKTGIKLLYNYKEVNFIGLYSVLTNMNRIKKVLRNCIDYVKTHNPKLILLVDFPSFNLKFAEEIKKFYKHKILYYISPQVWVWNPKRIEKIKRYIDRMMVIYPFEVEFYKKHNFDVDYVGNPLINKIENFLKTNKRITADKKIITLLPGSRDEEFKRNLYPLIEPVKKLKEIFKCEINLLLSPNINIDKYKNILEECSIEVKKYFEDEKFKLIFNSDLVITKFGTSSNECAFLETPFITIYKANPINYYIAKSLVKIKYVTLINIMSDSLIIKEFIQKDLTTKNICDESIKILNDEIYRAQMINKFREVKKILLEFPVKKSAAEIINEYLLNN